MNNMDEIYFFSPKSIGGNGRMAVIEKKPIPELTENINAVSAIIEQINGRSCIIQCNV